MILLSPLLSIKFHHSHRLSPSEECGLRKTVRLETTRQLKITRLRLTLAMVFEALVAFLVDFSIEGNEDFFWHYRTVVCGFSQLRINFS